MTSTEYIDELLQRNDGLEEQNFLLRQAANSALSELRLDNTEAAQRLLRQALCARGHQLTPGAKR